MSTSILDRYLNLVDSRVRALVEAASSADARQEAEAVDRLRPLGWWADHDHAFEALRHLPEDAAVRLVRLWREATGRELRQVSD